jgi:hypothetical protein
MRHLLVFYLYCVFRSFRGEFSLHFILKYYLYTQFTREGEASLLTRSGSVGLEVLKPALAHADFRNFRMHY